MVTNSKGAATLILGASVICSVCLDEAALAQTNPRVRPEARQAPAVQPLAAGDFDKLRQLIKPRPGGSDDIPWMTSLWEARQRAAAEGKPLLVWTGEGHPCGFT
jgi:hypothetical protein